MTASAHAIVGAAIATRIANPLIGLPLAFLSHFAGDKVPHWDPMTNHNTKTRERIILETILDVMLGFALVTLLFVLPHKQDPLYLYLAMITAQLPDWLETPQTIFHKDFFFSRPNYRLQKWVHDVGFDSRAQAPWGIISQVVVVAIFLFWGLS